MDAQEVVLRRLAASGLTGPLRPSPEQVAHDVRTMWEHLGRPPLPTQAAGLHHALDDARHVKVRWEALAEKAYRLGLDV